MNNEFASIETLKFSKILNVLNKYDLSKINIVNIKNSDELRNCIFDLLLTCFDGGEIDTRLKRTFKIEYDISFKQHHIHQTVKLNPVQHDLIHVEFRMLYPFIVANLIKRDKLRFNYVNMHKLYLYLYEHRASFKLHTKQYYNVKCILNCMFCFIITNENQWLFCDLSYNPFKKFIKDHIAYYGREALCWNTDDMWFVNDDRGIDLTQEMFIDPMLKLCRSDFTNVETYDFRKDRHYQRFLL